MPLLPSVLTTESEHGPVEGIAIPAAYVESFLAAVNSTTVPHIGLGILRAGAPTGSWTLTCNYFRVYFE